jgi:hypothetical protein
MKGKTSSGHDKISSKLLKSLKNEIAHPLPVLINNTLSSGVVPDSMKIASVLPLYKTKDQQLLCNYTPISPLPVLSKVLAKVVYIKLIKYLQLNELILRVSMCSENTILLCMVL